MVTGAVRFVPAAQSISSHGQRSRSAPAARAPSVKSRPRVVGGYRGARNANSASPPRANPHQIAPTNGVVERFFCASNRNTCTAPTSAAAPFDMEVDHFRTSHNTIRPQALVDQIPGQTYLTCKNLPFS
jgi:hypothetical protein